MTSERGRLLFGISDHLGVDREGLGADPVLSFLNKQGILLLKGNKLYMAVCFLYLVKTDLTSVRVHNSLH